MTSPEDRDRDRSCARNLARRVPAVRQTIVDRDRGPRLESSPPPHARSRGDGPLSCSQRLTRVSPERLQARRPEIVACEADICKHMIIEIV